MYSPSLGVGHHARDVDQSSILVRAAALCWVLCGAIFIAAASQITVALGASPVPLSLQSQAVAVVAAALGPRAGAAAVLTYLGAGLCGAPVFAAAHSGLQHLLGARGGYLLSYVPVALWVGRAQSQAWGWRLAAFCGAAMATLAAGTAWLSFGIGLKIALQVGLYPFVLVDTCKAAAAFLLVAAGRQVLRRWGRKYAA